MFHPPAADPLAQHHLDAGLRQHAARGAAATLTTQWAQVVLRIGSTAVLARLLTPADYGVVAMAVAFIGVGDAVWNLGLSTATIQSRTISTEHVNFFFWLQVALGVVVAVAVAAIGSPLLTAFYDDDALRAVTIVLSANFVLGGLGAQQLALLSRQMRFTLISVIDVISLLVSIVFAITVAVLGGRYWAIVAMTLSATATRTVLCWATSGWRPTPPRRTSGVAPMLRFGTNLGMTNILEYAAENTANILIGKMYGSMPLGLYSRAHTLLLVPLYQIHYPVSRVVVPVLSYLQSQPARYRRCFCTALSAETYMTIPVIATLGALAHEVVAILLGGQWHQAAPILQVLAIAGAMSTIRSANGWLFVSSGHTGRQAVWALVSRPITILGFVVGLPWGAIGVAWGFVVAQAVLFIPSFTLALKDTPVRLRDVATSTARPLALGAAAFTIAITSHAVLGARRPIVTLVVAVLALTAVASVLLLTSPALRRDITGLREALTTKLPLPVAGDERRPSTPTVERTPVPATASEL